MVANLFTSATGVTTRKKTLNQVGLLWIQWEKTLIQNRRRLAFIEADSGTKWTAEALNNEVLSLLKLLPEFEAGTRVAFCLTNGVQWMAFFLAMQKLGLAATPLDASLPEQACLEMARNLRCRALYLKDKFHVFEEARVGKKISCCIKLTSGTSGGLPNHVFCRAEHLVADGRNIIRTMGIRSDDRNLASIPLGHSYGLGNFVLPLILQGTPLVCATHFVPSQLIEWIGKYRVTIFPSVPAVFRVLGSMPGKSRLTPLRLAVSAGAILKAEVAQAFFERYRIKIHNFYGSSETGGICYDRTGAATLNGSSVGKPLDGVAVALDRGVIVVTSAAVAKRDGRWRMPDRGEWNSRGELVLLGRRGREVNIGGKKVHPSEVERTLRSIPGVSEAIIWGDSHSDRSFLRAVVETRLPLAAIQHALSAKLPNWKLPKHYVTVAELPRNERGKVDMAAVWQLSARSL